MCLKTRINEFGDDMLLFCIDYIYYYFIRMSLTKKQQQNIFNKRKM